MSDRLKLYAYWRSSASWRVRIVLYWKSLDFDIISINLVQGEQVNILRHVDNDEFISLKIRINLLIQWVLYRLYK